MRNRVERLRLWLLAGAGLLVLVLAAFIGSARYLRRHVLARLPAKLGIDIKSETSNFSLSHTSQSGTVYTIRASKELEHSNGKLTLYDASIMLYGPKQDRSDRIDGHEFEYDQNAGVVRAIGPVQIDMQAARTAGAGSDTKGAKGAEGAAGDRKMLHATTSGLVYMEKLGVAATSERIDFQLGGMTGHATGADYSSDSGELTLQSAVYVSGVPNGRPVVLTSSSAEIDNRNQVTYLTHAKYVSLGETVEGDQATLYTRADGSVSRIVAQGNVTAEAPGAKIVCAHADVLLNAQSQPISAVLTGGVAYSSDEPLRQRRGQADSAVIAFDKQAKPQPEHAVFTGAVKMTERTRATAAAKEPWSVRELTGAKVEVALVAPAPGRSQPREIEATGSPRVVAVDEGSLAQPRGEERTELAGDSLKMMLVDAGDAKHSARPDTLAGRGHTVLHQVTADGIEQTSLGDTLDAKFRPTAVAKAAKTASAVAVGGRETRQASDLLLSAVQQGHVTMMRRVPAKSGSNGAAGPRDAEIQHATAARAVYGGDLDRMTLTGGVQVIDAGSVLWANQAALDHKTGDALAEGAVKVDYVQQSSAKSGTARPGITQQSKGDAEPTHVLAERAELVHATQVATFYGKPARLWQGGSQVQAPVLEFARAQRRLIARGGVGSAGATEVHTVLVSAGNDAATPGQVSAKKAGATNGAAGPGAGKTGAGTAAGTCKAGVGNVPGSGTSGTASRAAQVVRIASRELIYSDLLRQADFTGDVVAQSADGTMKSREATAYLKSADAGAGPSTVGGTGAQPIALGGRIERVVATGKVDVEQPGLQATGERLVYTADDGLYLLTGASGALARVTDAQGSTTGAAFKFHSGDCSVEALGALPGEKTAGGRVRTDTTVEEKKSGSGKH